MKRIVFVFVFLACLLWPAILVQAQTATSFTTSVPTLGASFIELRGAPSGGQCLTYAINGSGCASCTAPVNGALSDFNTATGVLVYTPASGFAGGDSFTFVAVSTPCAGGTATTSSQATVTITVSSARTTISDKLTKPDGAAYTGTVLFVLTQRAVGADALVPGTATASATLDASGNFSISVYPSRGLSPQSFYQVWVKSGNRQELLGVYEIPANATPIRLPAALVGTDRQVAYSFVSQAAFNAALARSLSTGIYNNGTLQGTRPKLNFIAGANIGLTFADDSGNNRMDITISDPTGGSGGVVSSSSVGQLARYTGATSVTGLAFGTAHQLVGMNFSATGYEHKTISGSGGITVTNTPGSIALSLSSSPMTLNGQTGTTQTFNATSGACGVGFTVSSSSNQHTFCVPSAAQNRDGLVTTGTQKFGGAKTFQATNTTDIPLTVQHTSGGNLVQAWTDSNSIGHGYFYADAASSNNGFYADRIAAGNQTSAPSPAALVYVAHSDGSTVARGYDAQIATSYASGAPDHLGLRSSLTLTGSSSFLGVNQAAIRGFANYNASSSSTTFTALSGKLSLNNTGTLTNGRVIFGEAELTAAGTITNLPIFYGKTPVIGAGAITNLFGLYLEAMTGGTNNYALYTNSGIASLGDVLDVRGKSSAALSATAQARIWTDSNTNLLKLSLNGGAFGVVASYLEGFGALDFASLAAQSCADLTLSVSGAAADKPVWLGIPSASALAGVVFTARVSGAGTVTVTACNVTSSAQDPASGAFTARVGQ